MTEKNKTQDGRLNEKEAEIMKLYLVMKAVSGMVVAGQFCSLPDGEYVIPAFADLKKAEEHANNGKFDIHVVESE